MDDVIRLDARITAANSQAGPTAANVEFERLIVVIRYLRALRAALQAELDSL